MAVTDDLGVPPPAGFERQPPQDIQAEQSVLGGMLLSKDAIADVVEVVRSVDFYRPAHQVVYETILDLYGRGEPADPVTVSAELTRSGQLMRVGGTPYLHTLISSVPTAANAGYYAEIVAERAVLRRLVEAGTRIVQLGYGAASGQGGEVDDVVDRAQAEIYDVTERRMSEDYVRLEQLLQGTMDEIDAIASRGGTSIGVPTGFAELDERTHGLHPGQMIVIAARPAVGKALALDTHLPTPFGWTTMGDVQVGDQLIGADGSPTNVVAASDVLLGRPCYEVEFSDGTVVVADAQHQWRTTTRALRRPRSERVRPRFYWPRESVERAVRVARSAASEPDRTVTTREMLTEVGAGLQRGRPATALASRVARPVNAWHPVQHAEVVTTEEIMATLCCGSQDRRWNHAVAVAAPLTLPAADLPLPPYTLGVWLGDGHSMSARFTSADPEIVRNVEAEGIRVGQGGAPLSYELKLPPTCPDCGGQSTGSPRCQACWHEHDTVQAILRSLGVSGDKHIPPAYLRASGAQRRALLAGLLDTAGRVSDSGAVEFAVTSRRLAEDAFELVVSLAYRATMRTKPVERRSQESSTCYTVSFTPSDAVFRLSRKAGRQTTTARARDQRFIVAVRPVPSVPVRCVQVDSADHLFLASRSMIPTHNSTLALDIARSCSIRHGHTSVIFSLEMSKSEITMRLLSAEAKVPLHHMRSGHMSDDDWARLARRMGEVADAPLYVDDSPNLTMMEIRAKARRLRQRNDLRLVVVDYLQLMTSGKRVESRQQEVSEFSRSLKLLAKELAVPVIAISQLNRSPEQRQDKKPMLADLRESGAIEQDSDLVILLHREDIYERESPRAGEADLILAKHRNGPTGTVTVAFQGHYSRFVDMAT